MLHVHKTCHIQCSKRARQQRELGAPRAREEQKNQPGLGSYRDFSRLFNLKPGQALGLVKPGQAFGQKT